MKKQKLKSLIGIGAFLLAFILIIQSLSLFVFTRSNASMYRSKYYSQYAYLNEKSNTIDVVAIGNSNLYSGFSPLIMWQNSGITSTMAACGRQTPAKSYELLKDVLKTQSPKAVLIETDMLYDEKPCRTKGIVPAATKFDYFKTEYLDNKIDSLLTVFEFHDMWKGIFLNKYSISTPTSHGYKYSNCRKKFKVYDYMKHSDKSEDVSEINTYYLDKMIALCKEHSAVPVLVSMPSVSSWSSARHNAVGALAEKRKIAFLDLNNEYKKTGLDLSKSFSDSGTHLNYTGAEKTTLYITEYVKKHFNIADKRNNKEYASWNSDLKQFEQDIKTVQSCKK